MEVIVFTKKDGKVVCHVKDASYARCDFDQLQEIFVEWGKLEQYYVVDSVNIDLYL